MNFFTQQNPSPFYRDLRHIADDKTVLDNPHKGWYLHFIDNGMNRPVYRDDLEEGYYMEDVPGLNILYCRIDWGDIEKEQGIFDWSYIDDVMTKWGEHGYKFTFRFCTYEGSGGECAYATPKWVFDLGAKYIKVGEAYEPVYDDPIYFEHLEKFIAECSRKFNGNPLVEYVDVGTFGTWGEGHTFDGSRLSYSAEVFKKHIDLHIKYFNKTRILLNYGMPLQSLVKNTDYDGNWLADYCLLMGLGIRNDSINVPGYAAAFGYDSLQCPDLFDRFKEMAPVDLEHEHYVSTKPERFRSGFSYLEALKRVGATYAGFHGHITKWLPERADLHNYIANRLGYWYFINGCCLPPMMSGAPAKMNVNFTNRGFARAYNMYEAKVLLEDKDGNTFSVPCSGCDNTRWLPDTPVTEYLTLDLEKVPKGRYTLYFGLFEGETPIKFGVKKQFVKNGYCNFGDVTIG